MPLFTNCIEGQLFAMCNTLQYMTTYLKRATHAHIHTYIYVFVCLYIINIYSGICLKIFGNRP